MSAMNIRLAPGPHIHTNHDTKDIMRTLLIALLLPTAAGIYFFGTDALWIICISVASAVAAEWVWQKLAKKTVRIGDFSAAATGLILALNLPSTVPLWVPVVGSVFAIIVVKQLFGGIGHNFLNPALTARAALLASWPALMTKWALPVRSIGTAPVFADAVTFATPLAAIKNAGAVQGFSGVSTGAY
ncbi:MAG: Na+-transporting NADH:ubiquinone oxidoreductase subunit D, partial [Clostridiales bacterium]|nr:Na+-transporting NADH:ubiquinone oxidoreductase subunit D [Clostridiales bacterium]